MIFKSMYFSYLIDIYDALISPEIGDSVYVETWRPKKRNSNNVGNTSGMQCP